MDSLAADTMQGLDAREESLMPPTPPDTVSVEAMAGTQRHRRDMCASAAGAYTQALRSEKTPTHPLGYPRFEVRHDAPLLRAGILAR